MEQSFHWGTYREPLIFLMTAGLVVPLFRRLRVSPVLGFLIAGALLGPYGIGKLAKIWPWLNALTIGEVEKAAHLAEFGVVFLLFMIGLELSWERLVRMRRLVFGLGDRADAVARHMARPVARPGADRRRGARHVLDRHRHSRPVRTPPPQPRRRPHRLRHPAVPGFDGRAAPVHHPAARSQGRARVRAASVLDLGAGRRGDLRARLRRLFVAACLLVVVGASVASAAAGLSMGLGAFVAGLLLAETEFRREIEVTIAPFQGLLLGLFFLTTGASLDIGRVFQNPLVILGLAFCLIAVKAAIIYALGRAFRLGAPVAGEVSMLLAPGGEFAFLMIGAAIAAHVMPWVEGVDLMIVVTLTMVAIPFLGAFAAKVTTARPKDEAQFAHLAPGAGVSENTVIIVGFGRVGRLVSDLLKRHDIPFIAVDGAASLVAEAREDGVEIYWGNAARPEFLSRVGLGTARALVVTMDAPQAVEQVVTIAHGARPELTIVARARDAIHATHLYELGVTDAIPETIEASLQLADAVLVDIGVPMGYVMPSIHEKRDEYRKFLQPHGDRRREKRGIKMSTRIRDMNKPKKKIESEPQQQAQPQPAPPAKQEESGA